MLVFQLMRFLNQSAIAAEYLLEGFVIPGKLCVVRFSRQSYKCLSKKLKEAE